MTAARLTAAGIVVQTILVSSYAVWVLGIGISARDKACIVALIAALVGVAGLAVRSLGAGRIGKPKFAPPYLGAAAAGS